MTTKPKKGFAAMHPDRVREIASMGGKQAHLDGKAHRYTSEEARAAALKRHALRRTPLTTQEQGEAA